MIQDAGWALADESGAAFTNLIRSLPTRPRLLGLGEPTHGEEAFPHLRNQLFRHLVEHEGYRSVAIESDCLRGLTVDKFVTDGVGSLDDVMRDGFSHGWGEWAANRELVQWMRDYNRDRAAADRVRFFGFDAPMEMSAAESPRQALIALLRHFADAKLFPCTEDTILELTGDDERWTNPAAAMDPAQSVGASAEVATLRLIADDLQALLVMHAPHLIATTSREDWWQACLYGRSAAGLLRYHAGMADTSASRWALLTALRDAMMADNLNAIVETQPHTLVFAHNGHLQRDQSRWQWEDLVVDWWSAGAIVATRLGEQYAFVASALGSAPRQGISAPNTDSFEGVLSTLPANRYVLNSARLAEELRGTELVPRTSGKHGYSAFDPDHLGGSDGVVFIKEI